MKQSEAAYLRLRDDIVNLAVQPGDPLSESATAARLGISRTPVREAIRQLAQENLVTVIPDRGAFVAPVSLSDVAELFQLRQALEPFVAQLAATRPHVVIIESLIAEFDSAPALIDSGGTKEYLDLCARMDIALCSMAGNGRLMGVLTSIWRQCRRVRSMAGANHNRLIATIDENRAILQAVLAKDGDKAAALTREHLAHSLDNILQSFRGPI